MYMSHLRLKGMVWWGMRDFFQGCFVSSQDPGCGMTECGECRGGTGRDWTEQDGAGRNEIGWNVMGRDGTRNNRMGEKETEREGRYGTGRDESRERVGTGLE